LGEGIVGVQAIEERIVRILEEPRLYVCGGEHHVVLGHVARGARATIRPGKSRFEESLTAVGIRVTTAVVVVVFALPPIVVVVFALPPIVVVAAIAAAVVIPTVLTLDFAGRGLVRFVHDASARAQRQ